MHGEEPETVQLARGVLERVDAAAATCAIVLCANPDGIADATRQNARGVDLNRNFPATSWRAGTTPSYPAGIDPAQRVPANRTNVSSTGARPLSEPESTALAALIERLGPTLVLDLHAPLELVLTTPLVPEAVARELAEAAGMEVTDDIGSPVPARCATGSATTACPASPTSWSMPACPRFTRAISPGWRRSLSREARSVARLIATVSSMRRRSRRRASRTPECRRAAASSARAGRGSRGHRA